MERHCVIGVDIGTMGTKAAVYDAAGTLRGAAFEESILLYPQPGWVEQQPEDIYGSVLRTIARAVAESGVAAGDVVALALDGQMGGVCTVDRDWNAPTHYDSWLDNRCAPHLPALKRREAEILAKSGCAPFYNHGPKILYWRDEHPEAWSRIHSFVQPAAYAAGRLAGLRGDHAFMDRTYLNFTPFGDTAGGCWNEDLLRDFGLDTTKLPRIVEPTEIIGYLTRTAAEQTGLREGTPIAAGCGDQAANVLGAGIVTPGLAFDTAGTASVFSTVIDRFEVDTQYKTLMTAAHVVPGLYYAMAYVAGGGLNLRWFRDAFQPGDGATDAYKRLDAMAAEAPIGSDNLFFIPHMGGRNTPNNTDMRGAFIGLNWRHGTPQIFRAMMESIAYEYSLYLRSVRALAPDLDYRHVLNIGGGARSRVFQQIKANVLGLDYQRLGRDEFGTLGSALIAGAAVGLFPDIAATAAGFNKPEGAPVTPEPGATAAYARRAAFYAKLLEDSEGIFADLGSLDQTAVG